MPSGPVVVGIDETIERRWDARIKARGIYRDPVRSSRGHFVKASGLRWISLMLLAPVHFAGWVWALPFLTALAPPSATTRRKLLTAPIASSRSSRYRCLIVIGTEETAWCFSTTPALDEDVEHLAVLVHRTPEGVQLAPDADEHRVEVPRVARPWTAPLQRGGKQPAEAQAPLADSFVADQDAA